MATKVAERSINDLKNLIKEVITQNRKEYHLLDLTSRRLDAIDAYFDSISLLSDFGKFTQFAEDLTPKIIISCILNSGNNLFTDIVYKDNFGRVRFDIEKLNRRVRNNEHQIISPIVIGVRLGFIDNKELENLNKLQSSGINDIQVIITSPGQVKNIIKKEYGGLPK